MSRIRYCCALLFALGNGDADNAVLADAVDGIADLLGHIYSDLSADIEAAEDYIPTMEVTA